MTRSLQFLIAALALSYAFAENSIRFAGSTAGELRYTPPRFDVFQGYTTSGEEREYATCSNAYDTQPRVIFTANFATAGLRSFTALGARMQVQFLIYDKNWGQYSACNNLVYGRGYPGGYHTIVADPKVDFMYFNATTYYFVITGGYASWSPDGGYYAANIDPMNGTGPVSTTAMWRPPVVSNVNYGFAFAYTCGNDNSISYTDFTRYTWTQDSAGKFDIYLFLDGPAFTQPDSTFVLYEGTPTDAALYSDSCNTGASFIQAGRFEGNFYSGAMLASVTLKAGVTYSLVFSNDAAINWGVQIRPTRVAQLVASGWTQPVRNDGGACELSSVVNSPYYSFQFTSAVQRVYLISLNQWLGTYTDFYYAYVYNGSISIPANTCTPTTSLLTDATIYNVDSIAVVGSNITVVVVPGGQYTDITVPFLANILTGDQLGGFFAPAAGTSSSSTAVASASSSSTGKITSATSISSSSSTGAVASSSSSSTSAAASTTGSTTVKPVTTKPTTRKPTTRTPTTRRPTTKKPTTQKPSTRPPTTRTPTTRKPTTQKPTTQKPTTRA